MKVDLKKLDSYKAKHNEFRIVEIPPMKYLMIDGFGDPNSSKEFADATSALFPIAYKLKFMSKKELGKDYTVAPLEALWWAEDMSTFTTARDKSQWSWTLLNMVPEWVTDEMFDLAKSALVKKVSAEMLAKVRLEVLDEGLCVQTLHIGSYDDEAPVLHKLHHDFIPSNGLKMHKKHHEIYFSDFRKVAPEKLKTILRQPVIKG
jgi:hypothetical protein